MRRVNLGDRDNIVDAFNASLLKEFMCSLVKEESTDRGSTVIEVLESNFLLVETEVFSLEDGQTTLLFGLL